MFLAARASVYLTVLGLAGCLGPLVDDDLATSVLPAGSVVPQPEATLLAQIDANDHIDAEDRRHPYTTGFRDNGTMATWDFGPAQSQPLPMYVLVDFTGAAVADHPPVLGSVPGEPGYNPLCVVFTVRVGPNYNGQRMTSMAALRDARLSNPPLVAPPEPTSAVMPCPVVHPDVRLEHPSGDLIEPTSAYYEGAEVALFQFASFDLGPETDVPVNHLCTLRREGGEPLSEPLRRVDMTGDGDINDTNDIWLERADAPSVGLVRRVSVVVGADYQSIDSSGDEAVADFRSGSNLFDIDEAGELEPVVGNVVAWEPDDSVALIVAEQTSGGGQ